MAATKQEFNSRPLISNQFVHAKSGKTIKVTNPADSSLVGVAEATIPEDVEAALAPASATFKGVRFTFTCSGERTCLMKLTDDCRHCS